MTRLTPDRRRVRTYAEIRLVGGPADGEKRRVREVGPGYPPTSLTLIQYEVTGRRRPEIVLHRYVRPEGRHLDEWVYTYAEPNLGGPSEDAS